MKTSIKTAIASFLIALMLALTCIIGLESTAHALSPPPDGGYPGGNTAEGQNALFSRTIGNYNTGIGFSSLRALTTGNFNTAIGAATLLLNTADENTATGAGALLSNTGTANTANGAFALFSNIGGSFNTAVGDQALFSNTTGYYNTANGINALVSNTTGFQNTATGNAALANNTTGDFNTANGDSALFTNTTGTNNVASGLQALYSNITGFNNVANGQQALYHNTTGNFNTAIGIGAGGSLVTGNGNAYIGAGVLGDADESNTTRIRNIGSTPIVGGINVVVSGTGANGDQILGYASSSRRYKEEIKPMDKASETLFALKPVTFRAKGNMDPGKVKHYGLIAEDVAAVDCDLIVYNLDGKPETLRFDSINAMLLNEFLKEHRKVEQMQKQIEALTAGLQKVTAQLEVSKPAPQTVLNNQ